MNNSKLSTYFTIHKNRFFFKSARTCKLVKKVPFSEKYKTCTYVTEYVKVLSTEVRANFMSKLKIQEFTKLKKRNVRDTFYSLKYVNGSYARTSQSYQN